MPREPWRDDPEYLALWRAVRQEKDEDLGEPRLVLADWLEERGHLGAAWLERLHGLTASAPKVDPGSGAVFAGQVLLGEGNWARLLGAPPPEDRPIIFDRDVRAYQYLRRFKGPAGLAMGDGDWSSVKERQHLLAIPRLEALTCELIGLADWDWLTASLPRLTHLEAESPLIEPPALGMLLRLPRLRALSLRGNVVRDTTAMRGLTGLRHLSLRAYWFEADIIQRLVPAEAESLAIDITGLGQSVRWPRLRSLRHHEGDDGGPLDAKEVKALASYPMLECLDVRCRGLKAPAIKALSEMPRLRELALRFADGEKVPSLKALAKAPALESLSITGQMNDQHLIDAAGIRGLRSLSLTHLSGAGRGLAAIAEMPCLEKLQLHHGDCAGDPPVSLAALPVLEKLDMQFQTMAPEAAAALKATCPPWVECVMPEPEERG
jgi:uncharacterized protein (TIGR02996 family)